MTIIEFFDKNSIENIVSTLACAPEKVVLVCDSASRAARAAEGYKQVAQDRGLTVEFESRGVGRNNLQTVLAELTKLINRHGACVIDLAGGEELYLVAAGILSERYPDKVQLHRFNIRNNTVQDCDADGKVYGEVPLHVTAIENIRIYGGRVENEGALFSRPFDEETARDIRTMWEICKSDPLAWNRQMTALGTEDELFFDADEGRLTLEPAFAREMLARRGVPYALVPAVLRQLADAGLLLDLSIDEDRLSFTYKNDTVRKALSKAGTVLELYITLLMREIEEHGEPLYYDVQTGVQVDWNDGDEAVADVENEIDVIAMKGLIPIFISCKNGQVSTDELYKLSSVARRFGGKYAKCVLVATEIDRMGTRADYIRARAEDMGIRLIEDLGEKDEKEMKRLLRSLWLN